MINVLYYFNLVMTSINDVIYWPFRTINPIYSLTIFSSISGILLIWIMGHVSDQATIRRVKDRIQGHLLAIRIFQNNLRVSFRIQLNLLVTLGLYVGHMVKPTLIILIPVIIILIQLNGRYSYRPLKINESALVKVKLKDQKISNPSLRPYVTSTAAVTIETAAVYIPDEKEFDWRIRPNRDGRHILTIHYNNIKTTKHILVGDSKTLVSPIRPSESLLDVFFSPGEVPIETSNLIRSIAVTYPHLNLIMWGMNINWMVYFCIISIISGLIIKRIFNIDI